MANNTISVLELIWQLLNQETNDVGKVDFLPEKPAFDFSLKNESPLPVSTPEKQGIDSDYLSDFIEAIGNEKSAHIHHVLIIRHGYVIYDGSFDPYLPGVWHVTYSMCKSFTGMAIGLLIDDGKLKLEDKVIEVLRSKWESCFPQIMSIMRFGDLTIRDLLIMSSGVAFNETGAVTGNDWVKDYFESSVKFQPGSKFEYNSMNSLVLSAVVTELTGKTMVEFLKERLFTPMGIKEVFWESSPKGLSKGGWGMFLAPEDAGKLGLLYLNKGVYEGKRLISEEWITQSTTPQIETGLPHNPLYGYHVWMDSRPGSFYYNGMLGQNVHVFPDLDMVVVTNAGNPEVFSGGRLSDLMIRYFGPGFEPSKDPLGENTHAFNRLKKIRQTFEDPESVNPVILYGGWNRRAGLKEEGKWHRVHDLLRNIHGKTFEMEEKGVGLFPLLMQVIHNNYTHGIESIVFRMEKGALFLEIKEGAQLFVLPVGLGKGKHTAINMNGEDYLVGTKGRFGINEEGEIVLDLVISFIEEAAERNLKIIFKDADHIELHWDETPGNIMITNTLEQITVGSGNAGFLVESIFKSVNPRILYQSIQDAIAPVVRASAGIESIDK